MNLHTKDYPGDVHEVVEALNSQRLAYLFCIMVPNGGAGYTVVFKTTCYPDYLVLCERLGWVPMGTREYFSVGV